MQMSMPVAQVLIKADLKLLRCLRQWWIGNAAEDGRAATVFARLRVPSPDRSGTVDDHGVHAFVVPLRDASGNCLPGVEIHDCGYKVRSCCWPKSMCSAWPSRGLLWCARLQLSAEQPAKVQDFMVRRLQLGAASKGSHS